MRGMNGSGPKSIMFFRLMNYQRAGRECLRQYNFLACLDTVPFTPLCFCILYTSGSSFSVCFFEENACYCRVDRNREIRSRENLWSQVGRFWGDTLVFFVDISHYKWRCIRYENEISCRVSYWSVKFRVRKLKMKCFETYSANTHRPVRSIEIGRKWNPNFHAGVHECFGGVWHGVEITNPNWSVLASYRRVDLRVARIGFVGFKLVKVLAEVFPRPRIIVHKGTPLVKVLCSTELGPAEKVRRLMGWKKKGIRTSGRL